jgi:hypothetical protein
VRASSHGQASEHCSAFKVVQTGAGQQPARRAGCTKDHSRSNCNCTSVLEKRGSRQADRPYRTFLLDRTQNKQQISTWSNRARTGPTE